MKQETFQWQKGSHSYQVTLSPLQGGFHIQIEDVKTH